MGLLIASSGGLVNKVTASGEAVRLLDHRDRAIVTLCPWQIGGGGGYLREPCLDLQESVGICARPVICMNLGCQESNSNIH